VSPSKIRRYGTRTTSFVIARAPRRRGHCGARFADRLAAASWCCICVTHLWREPDSNHSSRAAVATELTLNSLLAISRRTASHHSAIGEKRPRFHRRWRSDAIEGLQRRTDKIRPRPVDATEDNPLLACFVEWVDVGFSFPISQFLSYGITPRLMAGPVGRCDGMLQFTGRTSRNHRRRLGDY